MWICFNNAFVSVVSHPDPSCSDQLMVRARRRNHLTRLFGKRARVYESPERDYRFRTFVKRDEFARMVADKIEHIDYTNFKDSTMKVDPELEQLYLKFWLEHLNYQEKQYGVSYHGWHDYYDQSGYHYDHYSS